MRLSILEDALIALLAKLDFRVLGSMSFRNDATGVKLTVPTIAPSNRRCITIYDNGDKLKTAYFKAGNHESLVKAATKILLERGYGPAVRNHRLRMLELLGGD